MNIKSDSEPNGEPNGNGDCYNIHGNMIADMFLKHESDGWLLCHGQAIGRGDIKGIKHGHAWLEFDGMVFDYGNGLNVTMRKEKYYKLGQLTNVIKYTPLQAVKLLSETQHYGCWNKKERKDVGM